LLAALVRAETISVSAAISLKEAMADEAKQYTADTGDKVSFHVGASGTLAAQIEQGAPVDLFISAGKSQVDAIVKDGLADASTETPIATNTLVLIVPKDSTNPPAKFEDLTDPRFTKIGIGDPKTVPAGQYAMQTFTSLQIESALTPKLAMGMSVRQVLLYVSRGEVQAGVVYATDAMQAADTVTVVATAPASSHDPIVYPAIILKAGKTDAAGSFLKFLRSDKGKAILTAHGFGLPTTQPD
jgi:molybdate transport system substrate-binding protein